MAWVGHAGWDYARDVSWTGARPERIDLVFEGLDTVASQLSFVFRHLATVPADRTALLADPDKIAGAVEELLRVYSIVRVGRKVVRDTEFHGCPLRAGDMVAMPLAFASRDDEAYEDAAAVKSQNTSEVKGRFEVDQALNRMLDRLDVGLNNEISGHHNGSRQRHQRSPAAGCGADNEQHAKPGSQFPFKGAACSKGQIVTRRGFVPGAVLGIEDKGQRRA